MNEAQTIKYQKINQYVAYTYHFNIYKLHKAKKKKIVTLMSWDSSMVTVTTTKGRTFKMTKVLTLNSFMLFYNT